MKKKMNVDSVDARGEKKKTLHVQGWFCSKQYIYDAQHGDLGKEARKVGFTKIECDSASYSAWGDL
jgi:hypothetical protein